MSSSSPPPPPCVIGEAPSVKAGGPEEVPPCSGPSGSGILLNIPRPSSLKQDSDSEEDGSESCLLSESDSSRLSPGTSSPSASSLGGKLTLSTLIQEDLIQSGEGVLSIDYLGQTFKGDLSPGGKIKSVETGMVFSNPSAWAIHCKKIVNPAKKSGCGWASVKYKGRKMDHYKNAWLKLKLERVSSTPTYPSSGTPVASLKEETPEKTPPKQAPSPVPSLHSAPALSSPPKILLNPQQQLQLQQLKLVPPNHFVLDNNSRVLQDCVLTHGQLGPKMSGDFMEALIEPEAFSPIASSGGGGGGVAGGKIQPFSVSLSSSVALIMDLHAHLHPKTVCGYLGGQWDISAHNLAITHAFPVMSKDPTTLSPAEAQEMEHKIYKSLYAKHLTLIGWYRSRPYAERALPSLKDCETQLDFQVKLLGASDATYSPCIGMILSTYGPKSSPPPQPLAYWVVPPPENNSGAQEYGKPMSLSYNLVSDPCLSSEVLDVINALTSPQNGIQIPLQAPLPGGKDSHLLRLGASLVPKFPRDQDERLWRYIRRRVLAPEFRDMEDPLLHYHQGLFAKGLEPEEDEIDDDEENALKNNDKGPLNTSIFPIKPPTAFPLDFSAKKDH